MNFGRNDYNDYFNDIHDHDGSVRDIPFDQDEPVFLIRGGDPIGPQLLMEYAKLISLSGSSSKVAISAFSHALKMKEWQKSHGTKDVDLMRSGESDVINKSRIDHIINLIEVDEKITGKVFDELIALFDESYGGDKLKIYLPTELRAIKDKPYYEPITPIPNECLLALGALNNKIIILRNKI